MEKVEGDAKAGECPRESMCHKSVSSQRPRPEERVTNGLMILMIVRCVTMRTVPCSHVYVYSIRQESVEIHKNAHLSRPRHRHTAPKIPRKILQGASGYCRHLLSSETALNWWRQFTSSPIRCTVGHIGSQPLLRVNIYRGKTITFWCKTWDSMCILIEYGKP